MLSSTRTEWGSVAKALHWGIVLLILLEVPAGFLMSYTYGLSFRDKQGSALHNLLSQIHHTNGFLILILVSFRLMWRLRGIAPRAHRLFRFQTPTVFASHFGLYALLFLLPLSGWAAMSVLGQRPWLFDRDDLVPTILPKLPVKDPYGYGFFVHIHVWCYELGAVILVVHIGAAIWHHLIARDDTFLRIWPFAKIDDRRD
jgi:cytochrome b561